ncbi:alpha/beta fold hydrolase (plasmid) [Thioclava litoralis]|uniref:Alpha/beta fold hydrolase n=1 Tax=Thioclava litoralis TaxID=3076557 RepID=A0ABZ1E5F1_9RHOB|nr:alpha/beta fold hydrolase [Thioclava sp. FTW29]
MSTTLHLSERLGTLGVTEAGTGAPLVLIHGVGMNSAAWGPQVDALAGRYRVIALDMPGHGRSSPLPDAARLPDFVDWLHQVLKALDLGPVNLVGHSMGALVCGGMAVEHPDQVARVALLNGVFRRDVAAREAVIARAALIAKGVFDLTTPLARWFSDAPEEQAVRAQVADWLRAVDPRGYATAYRAFAEGDSLYADRFGQIRCPLLALTGSGDPNSTPAMAEAMAKAAPYGHALTIEGQRHMVNLTDPARVNAALEKWLATPVLGEVVP